MKHTKEPWRIGSVDYRSIVNDNKLIAECFSEEDAQRIIDCVNALAGVENPKEFMEYVNKEPIEKVGHLLTLNARIQALEEGLKKINEFAGMKIESKENAFEMQSLIGSMCHNLLNK